MRTVLITGAGRGLGFALAEEHLRLGDRVIAWDYQVTDAMQELAKTKNLLIDSADISSTESVNQAADRAAEECDRIEILYNNAGVYYKGFYDEGRREILDYDFDTALSMYSINAAGAFRVTKALLQRNLLRAGSTVCMTSSEAGSLQYSKNFRTYEYTYCMSKAALNKGATLLYNDIGRKGMRVICFHPGWMKTQMGGEGAMVSPNDTAKGFMKFTLDFNSSSRENMFFKFDGAPLPW